MGGANHGKRSARNNRQYQDMRSRKSTGFQALLPILGDKKKKMLCEESVISNLYNP